MRPAAQGRSITPTVELDPAARAASCDAVRIQQVVWNLISNPVKFTPKGGTVGVTLARRQSSLEVAVSDNGEGITAFVQKWDARRVLLAGFQMHVRKPVDPHDLTAVIASLAGRTG